MYLFNKENIWSNPQQFPASCIHPDKYNNSVNRIIFQRRGERRSKERFFNLSSSTVVFPHSYKNYKDLRIQCILQCSTRNPATPSDSAYRINSSPRTTKLIPCRSVQDIFQQLFPVSPSILHGRIRLPRPYSTSRLPVILPGINSILGGRQHPRSPYSNSQAKFYITEFYQDSFQKG